MASERHKQALLQKPRKIHVHIQTRVQGRTDKDRDRGTLKHTQIETQPQFKKVRVVL